MTKSYCDICGRELNEEPHTRYKLKREWEICFDRGWERLEVHDKCWRILCEEVRKTKGKGK